MLKIPHCSNRSRSVPSSRFQLPQTKQTNERSLLLNYLVWKIAQANFSFCTGHQAANKLGQELSLYYLYIEQQSEINSRN